MIGIARDQLPIPRKIVLLLLYRIVFRTRCTKQCGEKSPRIVESCCYKTGRPDGRRPEIREVRHGRKGATTRQAGILRKGYRRQSCVERRARQDSRNNADEKQPRGRSLRRKLVCLSPQKMNPILLLFVSSSSTCS